MDALSRNARRLLITIASATALSGCTYTKSFVDLRLEDYVRDLGFRVLNSPEEVTPGSVVSTGGDSVAVLCAWPAVYTDLPPTSTPPVAPPGRFARLGLESWVKSRDIIRLLAPYYTVDSYTIGPVVKTEMTDPLDRSLLQVTDRCAQGVRDNVYGSKGNTQALVGGTLSVHVTFTLKPASEKMAAIIRPIVPELAKSLGGLTFHPESNLLDGQLVFGYEKSEVSLAALGISNKGASAQAQLGEGASIAGVWKLDRWVQEGFKLGPGEGSLTIAETAESDRYSGILRIASRESGVLETLELEVHGDTIRGQGKVLQGSWSNDAFNMQRRGSEELVGEVRGQDGVTASVRFLRVSSGK
jgi:hypothetical protein